MINICCLWVNDKYNYQYVKKLYNGVKRFIKCDFVFYCFVDTDEKIKQIDDVAIVPIKLSNKYQNVFNKIELISIPLSTSQHNNLYIDLDTLILDSFHDLVDWAIHYNSNLLSLCFCIWRMDKGIEFYQFGRNTNQRCTPYNSSLMCWSNTINLIDNDSYKYRGFDEFIWMNRILVENIPPEYYYSAYFEQFKHLDYPVCLLNQTDVKNDILIHDYNWIREYW